MESKNFLNAKDVANYMDISVPMAYKISRKRNEELGQQGYITIAGKISKVYFERKVFGALTA